jgi:hypothetical protein
MDYSRIQTGSPVKATLLNLETDEQIDFDGMKAEESLQFGSNFDVTPIYKTSNLQIIYQGSSPVTRSFTCFINRYWQAQDVRSVITILQAWQKPTKNKVPPLVAFNWGDSVFSPAIFQDGLNITEKGFIKGVPTQLEVSFTLLKVPDKALVM